MTDRHHTDEGFEERILDAEVAAAEPSDTDDERADRDRHLAHLARPLRWPNYPVQTVKRFREQGEFPDLGIMVPGSANVYRTNLLLLQNGPLGPQLEDVDVDLYASHGAAYDDGWRVD